MPSPMQKIKTQQYFCRQLYNLEHQVSGDVRLILSILQQQHQLPPQLRRETSSSASSLGPDLREVHKAAEKHEFQRDFKALLFQTSSDYTTSRSMRHNRGPPLMHGHQSVPQQDAFPTDKQRPYRWASLPSIFSSSPQFAIGFLDWKEWKVAWKARAATTLRGR